ncbi:hypothetical protein TNCV_4729761 [Trichonephila clavipes]|nr:hypothetical protein TNCV_4729761 [Trichonephila clavipes]
MFIFDLVVPMYAESYDNRLTMTGAKTFLFPRLRTISKTYVGFCRSPTVQFSVIGHAYQRIPLIRTATASSGVVQSGRPICDDFFQHLWPYIGNNTANVVFQMVKRLWLIPIDQ